MLPPSHLLMSRTVNPLPPMPVRRRGSTDSYRAYLQRMMEFNPQELTGLPADARANARRREILFCGSEQPFTAEYFSEPHPTPDVLGASLGIENATDPPRQLAQKSSGCGTQVHSAAMPELRLWSGGSRGVSGTVIALDEQYVPREAAVPLTRPGREACGCLSGYVGCAVW